VAGRYQARRHRGIGRLDEFHVKPLAGEGANLLGYDQRPVVWIDEPVQQDGELFGGGGLAAKEQKEVRKYVLF
jgi:hypothetical protein